MSYDWLAAIFYIVITIGVSKVGPWLVSQVPALEEMRQLNRAADREKMSRESFRTAVKINMKTAMWTNYAFYAAILPFSVSFTSRPIWQHLLEIVAILAIFDFMYYLAHRFLFHDGPLRKVHALHHQAHTPTFIDAQYVHPVETCLGLSLFLISIPIVALIEGAPLNTLSVTLAAVIFTQINTINHTYVNLPRFPYRSLNYLTGIHATHHVDMTKGNFATLTMAYDRLFGTYEKPVHRPTA
ncbi:MAG: hypothetical protein CL908_07115 [Deltaproteobacteria bacterium]|nr:hypothetical protein [Deltaproteobacteria bacterium]